MKMMTKMKTNYSLLILVALYLGACKVPSYVSREENKSVPSRYSNAQDTLNSASIQWRNYFNDPILIALIDTALKNNQELNMVLQEIEISKNEISI